MFTQLSDKATILRKEELVSGVGSNLKRDFNEIRDLRDHLAHANYYAETPEAARQVCQVVRKIRRIQADPSLPTYVRHGALQRIRVGRRQRKRTCWDCEREWKRMVVPL